jgi:hypothetical protein
MKYTTTITDKSGDAITVTGEFTPRIPGQTNASMVIADATNTDGMTVTLNADEARKALRQLIVNVPNS